MKNLPDLRGFNMDPAAMKILTVEQEVADAAHVGEGEGGLALFRARIEGAERTFALDRAGVAKSSKGEPMLHGDAVDPDTRAFLGWFECLLTVAAYDPDDAERVLGGPTRLPGAWKVF